MRFVGLRHLGADLTLGILNEQPSLCPLDEDDKSHDGKRHDDDPQNDECR